MGSNPFGEGYAPQGNVYQNPYAQQNPYNPPQPQSETSQGTYYNPQDAADNNAKVEFTEPTEPTEATEAEFTEPSDTFVNPVEPQDATESVDFNDKTEE